MLFHHAGLFYPGWGTGSCVRKSLRHRTCNGAQTQRLAFFCQALVEGEDREVH